MALALVPGHLSLVGGRNLGATGGRMVAGDVDDDDADDDSLGCSWQKTVCCQTKETALRLGDTKAVTLEHKKAERNIRNAIVLPPRCTPGRLLRLLHLIMPRIRWLSSSWFSLVIDTVMTFKGFPKAAVQ
eukprot:scaffold2214_cov139-Cylindrotheca_fusiformis.AAC.12